MVTQPNPPTAEDAVTIHAITNIVARAYRIVDNYSMTFGEANENESLADNLAEITETITALAVHYGIALVDCCYNPVDVHDPNGDRYAADPAARGWYATHGLYDPRADAIDIAERLRALANDALNAANNLRADVKRADLRYLAWIIEHPADADAEDIAAAMHPADA